ncbi:MAG: family 10 glycosylhydrolase, partial [Clostridia bacterium]|nr:family 10 glycosylhydrolase [Clostridia bacterium]
MKNFITLVLILSMCIVLFVPTTHADVTTVDNIEFISTSDDRCNFSGTGWSQSGTNSTLRSCDGTNAAWFTKNTGDSVTYDVTELEGMYDIYFWKNYRSGDNANDESVSVIVGHNGKAEELTVSFSEGDNSSNGKGWEYAGSFYFGSTVDESIVFTRTETNADVATRAGGIGFVKLSDYNSFDYEIDGKQAHLLDAHDKEFSVSNSTNWKLSATAAYFTPRGSGSKYTSVTGEKAKYDVSARGVEPGTYRVYYYKIFAGNKDEAKIQLTISHNGEADIVYPSNMAVDTGCKWVSLGEFYFDGADNEYLEFEKISSSYYTFRTGGIALAKVSDSDTTGIFDNDISLFRVTEKDGIYYAAAEGIARQNATFWFIGASYTDEDMHTLNKTKIIEAYGPQKGGKTTLEVEFKAEDLPGNNLKFMLWDGDRIYTPVTESVTEVPCEYIVDKEYLTNPVTELTDELYDKHMQMRHKTRGVIYNNDGNDTYSAYDEYPGDFNISAVDPKTITTENFLNKRTAGIEDTAVTTIMYCDGVWNSYHHDTSGETTTRKRDWSYKLSEYTGRDSLQTIIDYGDNHDIEVFWSMRMNDTHDMRYGEQWLDPWKLEHMDCLFSRKATTEEELRYGVQFWSAVDYGRPEVRQKTYNIIKDTVTRYDVDGIQMDFTRMPIYFKDVALNGIASEKNLDDMNNLVRSIRYMMNAVSVERNKPLMLSIIVPDSMAYCKALGLDIETWLKE